MNRLVGLTLVNGAWVVTKAGLSLDDAQAWLDATAAQSTIVVERTTAMRVTGTAVTEVRNLHRDGQWRMAIRPPEVPPPVLAETGVSAPTPTPTAAPQLIAVDVVAFFEGNAIVQRPFGLNPHAPHPFTGRWYAVPATALVRRPHRFGEDVCIAADVVARATPFAPLTDAVVEAKVMAIIAEAAASGTGTVLRELLATCRTIQRLAARSQPLYAALNAIYAAAAAMAHDDTAAEVLRQIDADLAHHRWLRTPVSGRGGRAAAGEARRDADRERDSGM